MVSQIAITIFKSSRSSRNSSNNYQREYQEGKKAIRRKAEMFAEYTNLEVDRKDHCHRVCRKVKDE